jgi:hypothetical protein
MTGLRLCAALAVTAVCASGQFISVGPGPRIAFETKSDPADLLSNFAAGFQSRSGPSFTVMHRYFSDPHTHTYFGYDLVNEPGPQVDTDQLRFFELGIGPLDFGVVDPSQWKKLPVAIPPAQVVKAGDSVAIEVWSDPASGQKITDYIHIQQAPQLRGLITAPTLLRNGMVGPIAREIPTVSGTARDYKVEDAELRLTQPSIKLNGVAQELARVPAVSGELVWFYIADHGRYVLSLAPRPELGFVKAGEVRGGAVTFSMGKDQFRLECPAAIATGFAPYTLYVLHDAEWKPTSAAQSGRVLIGSVSPAELSSLRGQ